MIKSVYAAGLLEFGLVRLERGRLLRQYPSDQVVVKAFDKNSALYPLSEPEPDISVNGYELWPGVFLE